MNLEKELERTLKKLGCEITFENKEVLVEFFAKLTIESHKREIDYLRKLKMEYEEYKRCLNEKI